MKWIDVLRILGPAVLAVVPGGQPFIPLVIAGMEIADKTQRPGAEKRKIAGEAVVLGAKTANEIAKREVLNEAEATKVYNDSVDAIVGVVNLVQKATEKE